ncbi:MAG: 4-hydroxy-tetrahydrodipicolinate reductase [Nocardioidaceae bacterium]
MSSGPVKVAVIGAYGRMGILACAAVEAADDLELVARIGSGDDLAHASGADVVVDLTRPDAVMDNIAWCVEHGISVVAGTSGFTTGRVESLRGLVGDQIALGVLVVPNFSVGAVLMMRFAAQAARYMESVEIIEMHHPDKVDAPSGTAQRTAVQVAQARRESGLGPLPDETSSQLPGARGATVDDIPVHSLRVRGLVAHQEVILGNSGETLTIRHDMLDRAAAMPGLLAAVRAVRRLPGVSVGLERVLRLEGADGPDGPDAQFDR